MSSAGVDFDFVRWLAARRNKEEQQAREGAAYAFSNERRFRRTLNLARPVTMVSIDSYPGHPHFKGIGELHQLQREAVAG